MMVAAIKNKFRPRMNAQSPSLVMALLSASIPVVWCLSPMFFLVTMYTGIRVLGVTLLPQFLPNTCTTAQRVGFTEAWPCHRDALVAAWHDGELLRIMDRNDLTPFYLWWPPTVLFWAVLLVWVLVMPAPPPAKKEEVVSSRCRRSDTDWQTEEKDSMMQQEV